jgi:hypothetical protein
MLLLTSTSDVIRVVTSAVSDIRVHADFADKTVGIDDVAMGRTNTAAITSATTTTVVGSPAVSTARNVKALYIHNVHATVTCDVTVEHYDGSIASRVSKATLLAGESLDFIEGLGFTHYDTNGSPKLAGYPRVSGAASVATITASAADTYMTGANLNVGGRLQAGSYFQWLVSASKTAAGVATPIYNIRFGTAGAIGDTARCVVTGVAQTAVADTGVIVVEAVVQSFGISGVLRGHAVVDHAAAATGFANSTSPDATNVSAGFDMTVANSIIGLSINPGTSGIWTITSVTLNAVNLLP